MNERAAEAFARRLPNSDSNVLERAGHDLFADAGPQVARLVRDWIVRLKR
jgi:pimeloyl-ACP methyl ester carboxylesterase